jgi:hypothetical protein
MLLNPYAFAAAGGLSLFAEVMADSPFMYLRLGEASGTNADNEVGATDGTYSGSYSLANAALYSGGPTSMAITANTGRCTWPGTSVPALNQMTIGCIVRPNAVTGIRQLISRDIDAGTRFWQYRTNGANLEFVKITGGVQTVSVAHGMSATTAYILHARVTSGGSVSLFKNGALLTTGSVTAANYGGSAATNIVIGNRSTNNEGQTSDRFSECFVIATAISDARILAQAHAGGFV